jgi:hypothetical protein
MANVQDAHDGTVGIGFTYGEENTIDVSSPAVEQLPDFRCELGVLTRQRTAVRERGQRFTAESSPEYQRAAASGERPSIQK